MAVNRSLGMNSDEVVTLQVDEAVAPTQVDPAHVDPVEQVSGVVSKVPQVLGQMDLGVEGVRYVEDDPLAGVLGGLACSVGQFDVPLVDILS